MMRSDLLMGVVIGLNQNKQFPKIVWLHEKRKNKIHLKNHIPKMTHDKVM